MSEALIDSSDRKNTRGLRWAVFISGNGTNLQALIDADPKVMISVVVSSRRDAPGVERARKSGIPVLWHSKENSWSALSQQLKIEFQIDHIFLLGFMRIVPADFITEWENKILNLHPSLLPQYKGLQAMERSYSEGASMGATVHWVTVGLDEGPILLQQEVFAPGVAQQFSFEVAKEKVQQAEKKLVLQAVRRLQG